MKPLDHDIVLWTTGTRKKQTLSTIIANEMGVNIKITSGTGN